MIRPKSRFSVVSIRMHYLEQARQAYERGDSKEGDKWMDRLLKISSLFAGKKKAADER